MLDQIEAFFSLRDRFKRFLAKGAEQPTAETLAGRFFSLFEAHGVHRNQIPRFFGHGLQLKDVQSDDALMQCLTDAHLADACELFNVQRQWLERGEGRAHVRHHFYLQPTAFGAFLDEMLAAGTALPEVVLKVELFGVLAPLSHVDSTLVIAQPIGLLNDEAIYRYHHVDCGPLGNWKSRVSTAALVAQALARKLWINGRNCNAKHLGRQTYEAELWATQSCDALMAGSHRMDAEDWLVEPDALLQGMDPEANRYGVTSALELWLKLEAQGLMKHPRAKLNGRTAFQAALDREKTV